MLAAAFWFPAAAGAQGSGGAHTHGAPPASAEEHMQGMADHAMSDMHAGHDDAMRLHMEMTPLRAATHDDTVQARAVVAELRQALGKYKDVANAERDGFAMFLPNVKQQRVFHYTSRRNAFREAFRFDPAQPTSLLYKRAANGQLELVGAMYTMPKRASLEKLDSRVPLSIARWHKHVNWCLPPRDQRARFLEQKDGHPVFGPESPIATKDACDAVGGEFHETLFGWMLHANVFAGDDLGSIFGDEH